MDTQMSYSAAKPRIDAIRLRRRFLGKMSLAGFIFWVTVLVLFALFFGLPLLWLLFAPSKLDNELLSLP